MLTYDSLIEEAQQRGMPPGKIRGILREYLQILILKELCRSKEAKKLYFTGGTYLRLAHGLKRFSEDLDFNSFRLTKKEFETLLKSMAGRLKQLGLETKIKFAHWGNVYVAKLTFPGVEKAYSAVSRYSKKEGIMIKLESNNLKQKVKKETQVISGFGEFYPCLCTDKGVLLADKIDALNKKNRGRHIYDIIFMLAKKFAVDKDALKALGILADPHQALLASLQRFSQAQLKKQAEILRPFLFDEKEADLLAQAHVIIPRLLEKY